MDDLWGSVFSSGGGRLLRRHPHHFPYHVSVMFGAPMRPEEANAGRLREAMQGLAAEALAGRGEVLRGMVRSVAGALGRQPWLTAVMVGDGSGRRLRRGELLARGMQLARRWEGLPGERIGVVLPPGLDAVTVVTALVLGGRVPVVIDVGLADEPGDLAAVMEKAGVRTVITRVAVRAALPERRGKVVGKGGGKGAGRRVAGPKLVPRAELKPEAPDVERVNALLDKIAASGMGSLSDAERADLQRASARLKERA
jgi:acyl-[acyl-carrier-protein]-phospholipid O-acyltransferase/long-chain-fatty-acid--[acyl-carrier-protein] ligase